MSAISVLLLGAGCAMFAPNPGPQDPFTIVEPGLAPQQRARPQYFPPYDAPPMMSPRSAPPQYQQPFAAPPPRGMWPRPLPGRPPATQMQPSPDPEYSSPPPSAPFRTAPKTPTRSTPRTFVDPDRPPNPIPIPQNEDNQTQRTERAPSPTTPPVDDTPLNGPALLPLEEAQTPSKSTGADSSSDRRLDFQVEVPSRRPIGSGAPFRLTIRNLSPQIIRNVSVLCEFDDALSFPGSNRKSVTHKIPRIDAGDAKDSALTLTSDTAGQHACRFTVLIGSRTVLQKSVTVEFVSRQLDWQLHGPTERTVGSRAEFNIPLINVSGQELRDLKIRVTLDAALTVKEMTQGGQLGDRSVTWDIDRLAANEGLLLQLEVECREPTMQACLQVAVSGVDLPQDESEACLAVKPRTGWLEVRLHDVTDPISIGEEAELVTVIQNEGLQSANDIVAACTWPDGMEFVKATIEQSGRSQPAIAEVDGRTATFAPLKKLAPNEAVTYHVVLKGNAAGTHRVTMSVTNSSDGTPVNVMEPVMVHR